jgi:macrophage erythroblast attacher
MTQLTNTMTELTSKTPNLSPQDVVGTLDTCIGRLQQLKRKLVETEQEEVKYVKRLRARIQHLNEFYSISNVDDETFKRWSKTRLDRILVDYLLRSGFHSSAERYASDLGLQVNS